MNRPPRPPRAPRSGVQGTDESTDAYDTIDWLVKNVPNTNGRVGTIGVSYPGWLTAVTGMGAHPALKAISPERWPSWRRFAEHPAYDSVWQSRALPRYMTHATVPTLVVGGWWDQEDEYGPLAHYRALERTDTAGLVHLVMGPWYHGQWSGDSGLALGNAQFGRPTGVEYRELQSRRRGCSTPGRTPGARSTAGPRRTRSTGVSTSGRAAGSPSSRRRTPRGSTSSYPTPRTPCPIARGRSSSPTRAPPAGGGGRRKTSVSWTAGPTCSRGRRHRSRKT